MTHQIMHTMDSVWITAPPPALQATIDPQTTNGVGMASNRLVGQSGAANTPATFTPATPLDLSDFEELRFWIRANRPAHGTPQRPFYLEFSFVDANDGPGEEHRWFVPVNRAGTWEQRRIGIEQETRSAVTSLHFRALTDLAFTCFIDELLAVREELLTDVETALQSQLDLPLALPGLTAIALSQATAAGTDQLVLPHLPGFQSGNQISVDNGGVAVQRTVVTATHDAATNTTTLQVDTPFTVALPAGVATVTLQVPAVWEAPPLVTFDSAAPAPVPALYLTYLDAREHLERTGYYLQRDSFRPRGDLIICSTRPAARAYTVDYQLTAVAPNRQQQRWLQEQLLRRLSLDEGLRINGAPAPLQLLAPPELDRRRLGELGPLYLRIGTRQERAPRQEQTWIRTAEINSGHAGTPWDQEVVTLEF